MKCTLTEEKGCFGFDIEPENSAEVVALARFGMTKTKELRTVHVSFNSDGTAGAGIVIGKSQTKSAYLS